MLAFRARYIFPIDSPPIRDGLVAIDHDRIIAVGPADSPALGDFLPVARDLGDVAILPGLINPHTHLEFSRFSRPLGSRGTAFSDWIRLVVEFQRIEREYLTSDGGKQPRSDRLEAALQAGFEQSTWAAVTTIGDIESGINSALRHVRPALLRNRSLEFELISFLEVIALKHSFIADAFGFLKAALDFRYKDASTQIRLGISPHAPYTVHPDLLVRCAILSAERRIPLTHHLAESREELMLLRAGRGPMVKMLEDFDVWDPDAIPFGSRPMDYLRVLAEADRALVIHGNYLDDDEIEFLVQCARWMSVIYCPRTHAYFQHDPYPLAKMLSSGVNVALGTDSRASNPDLSVLADARFAATQHPAVPPAMFLQMITRNAAQALGRDGEVGTLTPGKFADLAVAALPTGYAADPYEMILNPACTLVATVFRGRFVHGAQKLLGNDELT